jgi:DNA mismatch repair protein MutL
VNGRPFRSPALVRAVERGYRTTIPQGVRPWLFLYLTLPGEAVDVNVHPAKAEVRFRDSGAVEAFLEESVRRALDREDSAATFDRGGGVPALSVRETRDGAGAAPRRQGEKRSSTGVADSQMALFVSGVEAPNPGMITDASGGDDPPTGGPALRPMPSVPETGGRRPRLWQVLDTYVFAETRDGVLIVDQHSAHERILFQKLMDGFESGGQESQRLLFPLTLRLSAPEVAMIEDLGGLLARAGFEVEGFGGDTVIVQAVPNPHRYFDAERAFREMVHELTNGSDLVRSARNQHERIAATFACKSAIKAGQKLSEAEMQELFDQLFATELPHHDVHGRPTIVRLSSAELARKFGRT